MKTMFALMLAVLMGGCAVFEVRTSKYMNVNREMYPSTQDDLALCAYAYDSFDPIGFCFIATVAVVDLVPSLVVDTALLPYDAVLSITK